MDPDKKQSTKKIVQCLIEGYRSNIITLRDLEIMVEVNRGDDNPFE